MYTTPIPNVFFWGGAQISVNEPYIDNAVLLRFVCKTRKSRYRKDAPNV